MVGGGFGEALDPGQAGVPVGGQTGQPAGGRVQRFRAHGVADLAAMAVAGDEAGVRQDRQVLGDGLPADRQFGGSGGRGRLALGGDHLQRAGGGSARPGRSGPRRRRARQRSSPRSSGRQALGVGPDLRELAVPAGPVVVSVGDLLVIRQIE